jgi:hypothetical protein
MNFPILVGSSAMHQWNPQMFPKPKDKDYLGELPEAPIELGKVDYHQIPGHLYEILQMYSVGGVLRPFGCYFLKLSHSTFDVRWEKTARDLIKFQSAYPFTRQDPAVWDDHYHVFYKFWSEVHKNKKDRINLNKPNEDFFKDRVTRQYKHDDLHEMMKYGDRPWFEKLKDNKDLAFIPYKNFLQLPKEQQLEVPREEIYVTALERFILTGIETNPVRAYRSAIKKLVTTMSRGWFPRFIMENLIDLKDPDIDYVETFNQRKHKYETN